jgi:hypothetical protein
MGLSAILDSREKIKNLTQMKIKTSTVTTICSWVEGKRSVWTATINISLKKN